LVVVKPLNNDANDSEEKESKRYPIPPILFAYFFRTEEPEG
jgi:hypothetical protein